MVKSTGCPGCKLNISTIKSGVTKINNKIEINFKFSLGKTNFLNFLNHGYFLKIITNMNENEHQISNNDLGNSLNKLDVLWIFVSF